MSERRKLWEIAQDIVRSFDPDTGEVLSDRFDALFAELSDKAEAVHAVLQRLVADGGACRDESQRLAKRASEYEAQVKRLRNYMLVCMQAAQVDLVKTATLTASVRPGRDRIEITDVNALPDELVELTRKPDKRAIAERFARGEAVPGATVVTGDDTIAFR